LFDSLNVGENENSLYYNYDGNSPLSEANFMFTTFQKLSLFFSSACDYIDKGFYTGGNSQNQTQNCFNTRLDYYNGSHSAEDGNRTDSIDTEQYPL
jgi:hypothetical protein